MPKGKTLHIPSDPRLPNVNPQGNTLKNRYRACATGEDKNSTLLIIGRLCFHSLKKKEEEEKSTKWQYFCVFFMYLPRRPKIKSNAVANKIKVIR